MMGATTRLRLRVSLCIGCALIGASDVIHAGAGFQRGHVFVSYQYVEHCDLGGGEWIVSIDPETGQGSVFANSSDGICCVNGLRFTPDGSNLLAVNYGHCYLGHDGGWVQEFSPDGSSTIILDIANGLDRPLGSNAIAFDHEGRLHAVSGVHGRILRFGSLEEEAEVLADFDDSNPFYGGLEISHGGDVIFASWSDLIRITNGQQQEYQGIGGIGLAIDRFDNLYLGRAYGLARLSNLDPETEEILVDGVGDVNVVAANADGSVIYFASSCCPPALYALDVVSRSTRLCGVVDFLPTLFATPSGITVYAPIVPGDVSADGDVDFADLLSFVECYVGPSETPISPSCYPADFDHNFSTDLADFSILQRGFGG